MRKLLTSAVAAAIFSAAPAVSANDITPLTRPSPLGDAVKSLNVHERGPDGSTPLQWAVYEGDLERSQQLIQAGADVNASNNYGANAMQLAAEVANIEMLKLLLDAGADVDSPNPEGQTALMLVARTGNVEAARLLVDNGADINAREAWGGQSALMWASARRHPAMVEFLLEQGADKDANSLPRDYKRHVTAEGRAKRLDSGGLTALMYGIRENCKSCVELLIAHGADLDKPDPDGVSPLLLSILNNTWDISKMLINAGADVQQWDKFGQAPLIAAVANHSNPGLRVNQGLNETSGLEVLDMLLEKGANPNMELFYRPAQRRGGPLSRGTTPLIVAASNADLPVIQRLIEHGADAAHLQADRQSPVTALASARGSAEDIEAAMRLLVENGADVNVRAVPHHLQRQRGGTALHYAVRANNAAAIRALAALGADLDAKDQDGVTALDYAMSRAFVPFLQMRQPPNERMANLLRELGATRELEVTPHWPPVGPPFYYPWTIFPLDAYADLKMHSPIPGSYD